MKRLHLALAIAIVAVIGYLGAWHPTRMTPGGWDLPPTLWETALHAQAGGPWRLSRTTLAAAQTATATTVTLTSSTGVTQSAGNIAAPSSSQGRFAVWIDGELEPITANVGTNVWAVQRGLGVATGPATSHANASAAWFGLEGQFQYSDPPFGSCVSPMFVVPWINVTNAQVWLCRSSAWQATSHRNITFNSDPGQTSLSP